jgi:YDG domain
MRTRLRSKVTVLFVLSALLLAIPAVAALAQDTGTSTAAPTIQSDKADYAPGELVTLTGSGWQPGESVNVFVNDEEGQTWSRNVDISADASGNITDQFNLPDWFVATYKVTATGELSGVATTSFTDGNIWAKTSGLSIPIFVHWEKYNNNTNCSGIPDFSQGTLMPPNTPQLLTGVDDGQSIRMTLLGGPLGGPEGFVNWTSGSEVRTNLQICVAGSTAEQVWTANYGAAPTSVDTTITASNASATYGDSSATLHASVTPTSGTAAVNTGTVTFTVKNSAGTTIGNPVTSGTVSNGSASASFPLSGVNADTYTIEAAYNAGPGFNASNNSTQSPPPTLTVDQKTVTGSFTADNKVYDGGTSATILTRSLTGKVGTDDVSLSGGSATFANKHVGTGKTVTGTGFSLTGAKANNYILASSTSPRPPTSPPGP